MRAIDEILREQYFDMGNENQMLKAKIAAKIYAKEAIEADRRMLADKATVEIDKSYPDKYGEFHYVDKNSIINAPMIELK